MNLSLLQQIANISTVIPYAFAWAFSGYWFALAILGYPVHRKNLLLYCGLLAIKMGQCKRHTERARRPAAHPAAGGRLGARLGILLDNAPGGY